MGYDPLIDAIGEQQNFDAILPEHLEVRTISGRQEPVSGHIVDGILPHLHALSVIGKRDRLFRVAGMSRRKTKQLRNTLAVGNVLDDALLEDPTELKPKRRVLF